MTFIELTLRTAEPITLNTDHIATFRAKIGGDVYNGNELVAHKGKEVTEVQLAGPLPAHAFIEVTEPYDEVRRLIGLDWLTCGETSQGDICDRRLNKDGLCPIHGMVGE
jgi:hypothetical protein